MNILYFLFSFKGPYQPSHALMLKFYGYYKQATKGKCNQPKPSFWDVVGKAKWEAWNKCGNMTQQQAMKSYIDELKQVKYPFMNSFLIRLFILQR